MSLGLVSCRSEYLDDDRVYPPLGLLYLHQAVKESHPEIKVKVSDDLEEIIESDIIGVSIMTPQRKKATEILGQINGRTNAITIAGGPHVKHYGNEMAGQNWTYLIPNDGIRPLRRILSGVTLQRRLDDFMSQKEYKEWWVKPNRLDNAEFLKRFKYTLDGRESTTAMFAQGCPQKCTFCEDALTAVRWTPFNLIKEELDDVVELGYKGLYIFDDIFAIAMPKVKPITEELSKRDLVYRCNGQANYFTKWGEDFAKMLAESGCVEIAFGHESGSQEILDNVRKQTSIEQNYKSVEYAKKQGIKVKSFLMLGLPGETYETIQQTEDFIKNSGIDDFQLAIYYPYKGTQIRDSIDGDINSMDIYFEGEGLGAYGQKGGSTEAVVRTSTLSSGELLALRDNIVRKYKPQSHGKKWMHDQHLD